MQDVLDMLSTKILEGWTVMDEKVRENIYYYSLDFHTDHTSAVSDASRRQHSVAHERTENILWSM